MATTEYSKTVLSAIIQIEESTTLSQLSNILSKVLQRRGLRHIAYHLVKAPGYDAVENPLVILTYPKEWISRYINNSYVRLDPVVSNGLVGIMPTDWASLAYKAPEVKEFFQEAAAFGIGPQGLTMTIRGPHGDVALFTFTSDLERVAWTMLKVAILPSMLLLGHALHARVNAIILPHLQAIPKLSPREIQCLHYCARGMRDGQIASSLQLSEAVIRAYIDSARHKLNAPTRPHAVVKAIKHGLFSIL